MQMVCFLVGWVGQQPFVHFSTAESHTAEALLLNAPFLPLAFQLEEVVFVEPCSRVKIRIATGWVAVMHVRMPYTHARINVAFTKTR
jgi:hypothetical protein